jgi:hypothetical protein
VLFIIEEKFDGRSFNKEKRKPQGVPSSCHFLVTRETFNINPIKKTKTSGCVFISP